MVPHRPNDDKIMEGQLTSYEPSPRGFVPSCRQGKDARDKFMDRYCGVPDSFHMPVIKDLVSIVAHHL